MQLFCFNGVSHCVVLIVCFWLSGSAARGHLEEDPSGDPDAEADVLRQPCGTYRTCDLRSQHCDEVVGECADCADDCHPGRIQGDALATNECRVICELYYKHLATKNRLHDRGVVAADDDDDDGDDVVARTINNNDDDGSRVGQMSRRELHLLIELELLKMQSTVSTETIFCAMILTLLIIGFVWVRSFANSGQMKNRFLTDGIAEM